MFQFGKLLIYLLAELSHTVYVGICCTALRFQSNYLGIIQGLETNVIILQKHNPYLHGMS